MNYPPLPIDSEVTKAELLLFSALLAYHKGEIKELYFSFWGRRYRIMVDNDQINIKYIRGGTNE